MNKIKVLIEGYAKKTSSGWVATSSTTLIQTDKHKILVDPGINRELLLQKLKAENLTVNNIDYVFLTHYHPDHILMTALFEKATIFDGTTIYRNDDETEFTDLLPDTDIQVISTPGHSHEHASLVVKTVDLGTIVVAADVFWWTDQEKQDVDENSLLEKEDPFTVDKKTLVESRKKVLQVADWVIPGHGKMFQVKRKGSISES